MCEQRSLEVHTGAPAEQRQRRRDGRLVGLAEIARSRRAPPARSSPSRSSKASKPQLRHGRAGGRAPLCRPRAARPGSRSARAAGARWSSRGRRRTSGSSPRSRATRASRSGERAGSSVGSSTPGQAARAVDDLPASLIRVAIDVFLERFDADAVHHVDEAFVLAVAQLEVGLDQALDDVGHVGAREGRADDLAESSGRSGCRRSRSGTTPRRSYRRRGCRCGRRGGGRRRSCSRRC